MTHKISTKGLCDTIATSTVRYEKYRSWALRPSAKSGGGLVPLNQWSLWAATALNKDFWNKETLNMGKAATARNTPDSFFLKTEMRIRGVNFRSPVALK